MGLYDDVLIDDAVYLPRYPEERPRPETWQSKTIGRPAMETYRIGADGRLYRREQSLRELTDEEKRAEAREYGFDSWEAYATAHEAARESGLSAVFDLGPEGETPPPVLTERTVDEVWWADHSMHGSFEFYANLERAVDGPDVLVSYEARFTRGDLDRIVLLGERGSTDGSPEAVERALRAWTEE